MDSHRYPARRIAVLHLNQIGDLLFSLPLLRALRERGPDVHLASVVRPHLADLIAAAETVDDVAVLPAKRGDAWVIARALRRGRFDLVITLSGSHSQVLGAYLARVRWRVGFADAVLPFLLTSRAAGMGVPSLEKMATMARHLGCDSALDDYTGLVGANDEQRQAAQRLLESAGASPGDSLAVLAPGASARRQHKAWRADGFAAAADALATCHGLAPVLLGGAGDREQADAICRLSHTPIVNLVGGTTTGEALGVLAGCSLFVGIDSGLMHMAAALDLPVVALFGPTDPAVTGPRCSISAIVRHDLPCSPCHDPACRHRECMDSIQPDEVLEAVGHVLSVARSASSAPSPPAVATRSWSHPGRRGEKRGRI